MFFLAAMIFGFALYGVLLGGTLALITSGDGDLIFAGLVASLFLLMVGCAVVGEILQ